MEPFSPFKLIFLHLSHSLLITITMSKLALKMYQEVLSSTHSYNNKCFNKHLPYKTRLKKIKIYSNIATLFLLRRAKIHLQAQLGLVVHQIFLGSQSIKYAQLNWENQRAFMYKTQLKRTK